MMIPLHPGLSPTQKSEGDETDDTVPAPAFIFPGFPQNSFPSSSILTLGPRYPDTSSSIPIGQVDFALEAAQHRPSAFVASNSTFSSNDPEGLFPIDAIWHDTGRVPWMPSSPGGEYTLTPVSTEVPETNDASHDSDRLFWSSFTEWAFDPVSHTTNPNPQTPTLDPNIEQCLQDFMNTFAFVASPPSQPEAESSPMNLSIFNTENFAVSTNEDASMRVIHSEPEAIQDLYSTAVPTLQYQVVSSSGNLVNYCGWTDEDGICGEEITSETLPGHLAKHRVKNLNRSHRMRCLWIGCKTKRLMNRESIVRHIREVHLRMKRPSKRVQNPHPFPDCYVNTGSFYSTLP